MTLADMIIYLDAYKEKMRLQRMLNYELAANIVCFLGCSFNGKPLPPFEKEDETKVLAEQWKAYADAYNAKLAKKE